MKFIARLVIGILMVVNGVGATILWRIMGLSEGFYEVGPGIAVGLLTYAIGSRTDWNKTNQHPANV